MRTILLIFLIFANLSAFTQNKTRVVRGTLNDPESNVPMPGVNVVIKGTSIGTVSDVNGNYEIEAPVGSTLVFSFVGYTSKEVLVTEDTGDDEADEKELGHKFHHTIPDSPEKTLSPYFFVKSDDPSIDQMPLKSTSASVKIAGVIADVNIRQVYVNAGKNALEAVYIFPGSTRAAVYGMTMTIGNRKLTAKIREKERARKEYETAKKEGKSTTLLEQKRPNIFQMNVANIMPGDTISVDMHYTELLIPTEGMYEFVYPTVVGPRYSETPDNEEHRDENWSKNPYLSEGEAPDYSFDFKAILNSGIPIQKVVSPSHHVSLQFESKTRAIITLDEKETFGGNRDLIIRYRLRGGEVESGLLLNPRSDENFFLMMLEPPQAPTLEQIPAREYIFIFDVSGSMQGFPIGVSKTLLRKLISNLRPTDRFNVMLFESSNSMLHERSVEANEENINEAIRVLDRQQGGGGTRLYPALQNALLHPKDDEYSRTFIVVTDGYVTIEKEAFNLIRNRLGEANLFAFGIGSSVNRYLIEGLAHAGMGEPFIVTNEKEAETVGKKFRELIERPVLTNIRVDYSNFDTYDIEPVSIPDVFAERPIIVYGKYHGAAKGTIRISGYSGSRLWHRTIDVSSAMGEGNNALRYLWARNRIKYLDDYARYFEDGDNGYAPGQSEKRVAEVTRLGLKYNLLTQYTSFIAVDSVIRNREPGVEVKHPLPMPLGVPNSAIGVAGISLSPDVQSLSEVVVTGYGLQSKGCLVASVASVESYSLDADFTIAEALQGRISGLQVSQNSGGPGTNTTIRIRGNSSIANANGPLYVIDGIPVDNTNRPAGANTAPSEDKLASLDPEQIESIQVLKDANTATIYGSRGSNGVIIITTKDPKSAKRQLQFSTGFSMQRVNRLPERQSDYAQGSPVNGVSQWRGPETGELFSWGPALSTLYFDGTSYDYDRHGKLILNGTGMRAKSYDPYSLFKTAFSTDNNLRFSQSSRGFKYDVSLGYKSSGNVVPGTGSRTVTSQWMMEKVLEKISFGFRNSLSSESRDLPFLGNSGSSIMYSLLTNPASFDIGNGLTGNKAFRSKNSYLLSTGDQRGYTAGVDNPYWSLHFNRAEGRIIKINPSLYSDVRFNPWLKLKAKAGGELYRDRYTSGFDIGSGMAADGAFTRRHEEYKALNTEALFEARKRFLDDQLETTFSTGYAGLIATRNINRTDASRLGERGNFNEDNAQTIRERLMTFNQSNHRWLSKLEFNYKEIAVVNVQSTREKTSTLDQGIHTENVGFGFTFSELEFINQLNLFSRGRITGSIGQSEREAPLFLDPNLQIRSVNETTFNNYFPERIQYKTQGLSPERVVSRELGGNFDFFNNRLELSAALYRRNTYDAYIPLNTDSGWTLVNGGAIEGKGVELDVIARPVIRELSWTVKTNFSKNTSYVTSLPSGIGSVALSGFTEVASSLVAGQPYGALVGSRYLRDSNGRKIIGDDGFPLIDPVQGVIGNPNPKWIMGVENSFRWKAFSMSFLVDIKHGGQIWNGTRSTMNYFGTGGQTAGGRNVTGYVFEGVNKTGEPNTIAIDFANLVNGLAGNRWVRYGTAGVGEDGIEDASWVRLRNVSLTWNVNQNLVSRARMKNVSITFQGRNLLLFTKYSGVDPDTNLTGNTNGRGIDYFNLPNVRSYSVMLKVTL